MNGSAAGEIGIRLNSLLERAGQPLLATAILEKFEQYLSLLQRWNARTNLTSVRDVDGILTRHFLESILCANLIPIGTRTLLDYGSGAGFPGLPVAICRPDISVQLAEAHGKKVAFLNEVVRQLGVGVAVSHLRAETLPGPFEVITLRAVERMAEAVEVASRKLMQDGWLILIASSGDLPELQAAVGDCFEWKITPIPESDTRVIAIGQRR